MTPARAMEKAGYHFLPAIYRRIITVLAEAPATSKEIAPVIYTTRQSVDYAIRKLRGWKVVYIAYYTRSENGGPPIPSYAVGQMKDAERPKPMTFSERCRRHRAKKREVRKLIESLPSPRLGFLGV